VPRVNAPHVNNCVDHQHFLRAHVGCFKVEVKRELKLHVSLKNQLIFQQVA
jgi:hypothetical protein